MKFLTCLVLLLVLQLKAQNPDQNEARLKSLTEEKTEFNKLTEGTYDGFRVKIHFGGDREAAQAVKVSFMERFNNVPVYEKYIQPNFTILVGDFQTKLEAYEFMKTIQPAFPAAFIVKDKIKPVNYKTDTTGNR